MSTEPSSLLVITASESKKVVKLHVNDGCDTGESSTCILVYVFSYWKNEMM
jgi:hypothetical protein